MVRRLEHRLRGPLLVAPVILACVACSGGATPEPASVATSGAGVSFIDQLGSSSASWSLQPFTSLSDLLPSSTLYDASGDGAPPEPIVKALVVGEVVDVQPGYGFPASVPNDGHDYRMGFASSESDWSTATLTVKVDEIVSAADGVDIGDTVQVGMRLLPTGGTMERSVYDVDSVFDSLLNSGRTLFVLDVNEDQPKLYPQDGKVYDLFMAGDWWAPIGDEGEISLPVVDEGQEKIWLSDADTLSELRDGASEPLRVIEVSSAEATWLRND